VYGDAARLTSRRSPLGCGRPQFSRSRPPERCASSCRNAVREMYPMIAGICPARPRSTAARWVAGRSAIWTQPPGKRRTRWLRTGRRRLGAQPADSRPGCPDRRGPADGPLPGQGQLQRVAARSSSSVVTDVPRRACTLLRVQPGGRGWMHTTSGGPLHLAARRGGGQRWLLNPAGCGVRILVREIQLTNPLNLIDVS
jgi:hypothetical protein